MVCWRIKTGSKSPNPEKKTHPIIPPPPNLTISQCSQTGNVHLRKEVWFITQYMFTLLTLSSASGFYITPSDACLWTWWLWLRNGIGWFNNGVHLKNNNRINNQINTAMPQGIKTQMLPLGMRIVFFWKCINSCRHNFKNLNTFLICYTWYLLGGAWYILYMP